jgi:hypothetical protein
MTTVVDRLAVIHLSGDPAADLAAAGLARGTIKHATRHGFAFRNPDGSRYATKTNAPGPWSVQ